MPGCFRLLIGGAAGTGKKTIANILSEKYGWKIADWLEICQRKEDWMRNQGETHRPNNPLEETYGLGLSEAEWNDVLNGKPLTAFNLLPWFYEHLNLECEKKRPPPPAEGEGEGDDAEKIQKELEEKKKQEELKRKQDKKKKDKEKKKKEKEKPKEGEGEGDEEEEEEEPLEDLPISEIDLKVIDEQSLKKPFIGGFILINYPQTAEQCEKLKAAGVGFDKVLFLADTDEENPGEVLKSRNEYNEFFDLAFETENSDRLLGIYKEQFEDAVNEISCNGSLEEV